MAAYFDQYQNNTAPSSATTTFTGFNYSTGVNVVALYAGGGSPMRLSSVSINGNACTARSVNTSSGLNQPVGLYEWDNAGSAGTGDIVVVTTSGTAFRISVALWGLEDVTWVSGSNVTDEGTQTLSFSTTTSAGDIALATALMLDAEYVAGDTIMSGYTKDYDAVAEATRYSVGGHNFNCTGGSETLEFDCDEAVFTVFAGAGGVWRPNATDTSISATTDALTLTEFAASVANDVGVSATTDGLTLTEFAATITKDVGVAATTDALTLTEYPASITLDVGVSTATDVLTLTEFPATVSLTTGTNVTTNTDALTLTEYPATLTFDVNVGASADVLTLTEYRASISTGIEEHVSKGWLPTVYVDENGRPVSEKEIKIAVKKTESRVKRIAPEAVKEVKAAAQEVRATLNAQADGRISENLQTLLDVAQQIDRRTEKAIVAFIEAQQAAQVQHENEELALILLMAA